MREFGTCKSHTQKKDIVAHANNVKSYFKQMMLHPGIVADFMYLQPALPFGVNFLPQNWEPVRRVVNILAEKLST